MDFETLLFDKEDGLGIITLNRPKSLNGLNDVLLRELSQLMDLIAGDEEIKAVILTGGKKVFAAGGDIAYIASLDAVGAASFVALAQDAMDKIDRLGKPVIAAVCGLALGGGCELALAADIRLAADGAVFGLPEINLGIIPGAGGTQRLTRAVGPGWAKYLVYTGDSIDGDLALKIGLINGLFPQEQLMEEARKLAKKLAAKAPLALKAAKSCINFGIGVDLASGLQYEQKTWALLFATQDQSYEFPSKSTHPIIPPCIPRSEVDLSII
jgi:enoyl-CoA hydratase